MRYYTFEIEDEKVGYYEEDDSGGVLYACAYMSLDHGEIVNPFWVKHDDGKITAYKCGDGEYQDFDEQHNEQGNVYPSSAVPFLLLQQLNDGDTLDYYSFHEAEGAIEALATLTRTGDKITETIDGEEQRFFILDSESTSVKTYNWGGAAFSHRVATKEEATRGTAWEKPIS